MSAETQPRDLQDAGQKHHRLCQDAWSVGLHSVLYTILSETNSQGSPKKNLSILYSQSTIKNLLAVSRPSNTKSSGLYRAHRDIYRVIHKSVKQVKNSQQIDYATDHGHSYVDRERNCLSFF